MRQDKRGFFSIDAVFAVTLLMIVWIALVNTYEGRTQAAESVGASEEAKMVCEKLAATINTVYANGLGFEARLNLPPRVRGNEYILHIDNDQRAVMAENLDAGINPNTARAPIVCKNIVEVTLDSDNLSRTLKVYWLNDQVGVANV
jgi:hypothetical protein